MVRCFVILIYVKVRTRNCSSLCHFRDVIPPCWTVHVVEFVSYFKMMFRVPIPSFRSSFVKLLPEAIIRSFGTRSFGRRTNAVIVSRRNTFARIFFSRFHPVKCVPAFSDPGPTVIFQSNIMFAWYCLSRVRLFVYYGGWPCESYETSQGQSGNQVPYVGPGPHSSYVLSKDFR